MAGFFVGVASGAVQYWLLSRFVGAVTGGKVDYRVALFAVSQFFLPLAVLICCALLLHLSLFLAGVGMVATLIACAVVRFFLSGSS